MNALSPLCLVVFSGRFEKVHYALAMASAALATNRPVTLFFTMQAARTLFAGTQGWTSLEGDGKRSAREIDQDFGNRGVARFEELLDACVELGGQFMLCDMGIRALGLEEEPLREDVDITTGGLVTFLNEAGDLGQIVFI